MADDQVVIELVGVWNSLKATLAQADAGITAFANQTVAKLDAVGAKTEALATGFNHLRYAIGAALAAVGVVFGLKALDDAASRVRTSLDEAANSVKNLGGSLDKAQVQAFVMDLATGAAAGVASTTDLFNSVQTLGLHVKNTTQLERAMQDAVQLAAATHESYGEAVNQVARGLAGYITILVRAGLITKDEALNIHSVEQAMEVLAEKTKNATDAIDPNEKAWGRLQNTLENIKIELGQGFAPAMLKAVNGTNDWLSALNNLVPDLQAGTVAMVNFFRQVGDGARQLTDVGGIMAHFSGGVAHLWGVGADIATHNFKGAIDQANAALDQFHALKDAWVDENKSTKYLSFADIFGKVDTSKVPVTKHTGDGGFTGDVGMKSGPDQAAKDAVSNAKAQINAMVDAAVEEVDAAKARFDLAKANTETFKAQLPHGKIETQAQALEYARLTNAEIAREQDVRAAIVRQMQAETAAARDYKEIAASIPSSLKSHVEIQNQLLAEARKHITAVLTLQAEYSNLRGVVAGLVKDLQIPAQELGALAVSELQKQGRGKATGVQSQLEDVRFKEETVKQSGRGETPQQSAGFGVQRAMLEQQLASLALSVAHGVLAIDQATKGISPDKIISDQDAVSQSELGVKKASDDLAISLENQDRAGTQFGKNMLDMIPAVAQYKSAIQAGATPLQAIFSLLAQKSIAVHLAIQMLENILTVVARVLDAVLVPVLMVLNRILTTIVNIFIDLWNAIARLLQVLGVHVDTIKNITSLFGDLGQQVRPLIDIVHDLPTLKEMGKGQWGPLQPDQFGNSGGLMGGLLNNSQLQLNGIQRIIGLLGAVLAIDWLTHSKWWSSISSIFSNLWNKAQTWWGDLSQKSQKTIEGGAMILGGIGLLNTHTTGVMGTLEKIYGIFMIVQGILQLIAVLTATKAVPGVGWLLCPAVDQIMETKENGFIRAGDLKPGMHLPAPKDGLTPSLVDENGRGWNILHGVRILPTTIVRSTNEVESLDVNWNHAFKDKNDEWTLARELNPGDELLRDGGGVVKIVSTDIMGPGEFAALDCHNHEYVIGTTIGHNDSGAAAMQLGSTATKLLGDHIGAIANSPRNLASSANRVLSVAGGRSGGSGASGAGGPVDNSTSVNQSVSIGTVQGMADLEALLEGLSFDAAAFSRGRQYQQGYSPL